ncbi:MAG: hypothetical protein ACLFQA_06820 [Bacteroidales bacterium]
METELEKVLMSFYKTDMISYLSHHPESFEEALHLAITDKQPYSWRAAWLLWSCMDENDIRIRGHIRSIIECIREKSDGHQRELLKILYLMEIDEEFEGILFDHCIRIWEKINKKPSVRFTAFKVIVKISRKYPELSKEIGFLTQDHYMEALSKGIRHSLNRMINGLETNDQ